jgi:hypothetical protein
LLPVTAVESSEVSRFDSAGNGESAEGDGVPSVLFIGNIRTDSKVWPIRDRWSDLLSLSEVKLC